VSTQGYPRALWVVMGGMDFELPEHGHGRAALLHACEDMVDDLLEMKRFLMDAMELG